MRLLNHFTPRIDLISLARVSLISLFFFFSLPTTPLIFSIIKIIIIKKGRELAATPCLREIKYG